VTVVGCTLNIRSNLLRRSDSRTRRTLGPVETLQIQAYSCWS